MQDWRMSRVGALFCLISAAGFGAMGIFGKLAYDEGTTVGTLLATRFVLAAALFWVVLLVTGGVRRLRSASPSHSAASGTARRPAPTSRHSTASTPRCSPCSSTPIR
jgi:drug/metabolite transporter (DMT)-like permease